MLRDHDKHEEFIGPRFFVYAANLEMNPLDTEDRVPELKDQHGIGYCNITKCCTKVCPEHIHITDNAIIPLKERVVDRFYDPVTQAAAHLQVVDSVGRVLLFRPAANDSRTSLTTLPCRSGNRRTTPSCRDLISDSQSMD